MGIKQDCGYRLDIVVENKIIFSKIYPQRPLRLCGELLCPGQVLPAASGDVSAYSMETMLRPLRFERYIA